MKSLADVYHICACGQSKFGLLKPLAKHLPFKTMNHVRVMPSAHQNRLLPATNKCFLTKHDTELKCDLSQNVGSDTEVNCFDKGAG